MKSHGHSVIDSGWSIGYRIALIVVLLLLDGCAKKDASSQPQSEPASSTSSPPSSSRPEPQRPTNGKLTEAEMKYGVAPPRNSENFVYRDDVVIVDHGADAVRSLSPDGMTWTIDATAPHSDEIQPGKIMFLTNRAVGRVLSAERKGNDLAVILGPVELPDVYKEAHVTVDQPLDLDSMIAYPAPYPGAEGAVITSRLEASENSLTSRTMNTVPSFVEQPVALREALSKAPGGPMVNAMRALPFPVSPIHAAAFSYLGPPAQDPGSPNRQIKVDMSDFKIKPFCCGGFGMRADYSKRGLNISVGMALLLDKPYVFAKIAVFPDRRVDATLELRGAAGLQAGFEASNSDSAVDVNINDDIPIPVDLAFNLVGAIQQPFAVTLRQRFIIKTAFSAKNSTLTAGCKYKFGGTIHMGFHNGSFDAGASTFDPGQCLLNSVNGMSLGATAIVIALQGKLIVGIGAAGFVAGPYVGYDTSIGITRGSDQTTALVGTTCRSSDLAVSVDAGVGFAIPQPIVSAINFFLRAVHLKEIDGVGAIKPLKKEIIPHRHDWIGGAC